MTMGELPAWRRPPADPEPDEPARPGPLAGEIVRAYAAEEYARALYEGYRDGPPYADTGRPSLQRLYEEWQEAVRRREALEREGARALGEAGR